eukprot:1723290-Rhodomonas_salina.1
MQRVGLAFEHTALHAPCSALPPSPPRYPFPRLTGSSAPALSSCTCALSLPLPRPGRLRERMTLAPKPEPLKPEA